MDKERCDLRDQLDPELRRVLPSGLMTELLAEAWSPVLSRCPLFHLIRSRHPRTEFRLCYEALSEVHALKGNTVFTTGDACIRMLFCVQGSYLYVQAKDHDSCLKLQRGHSNPDIR